MCRSTWLWIVVPAMKAVYGAIRRAISCAIRRTRGEAGCSLLLDGRWVESEGVRVELHDAVGAGDAFAAAFVHGLGQGWEPERIGAFANRVGALVASRAGAIPPWRAEEAWGL